jgi:hypothetical protein
MPKDYLSDKDFLKSLSKKQLALILAEMIQKPFSTTETNANGNSYLIPNN